ncbi:MAG TPA: DUF1877 family protein [Rhodothermales bacterium]|nr:DUF1877 family protein [Rhodothermales bacterium]
MGIYARYTAVPPEEIARAQEDEDLWGTLGFDPPLQYPGCDLQRSWSTLWYLLDPRRREDQHLKRASNILGKAIMGAHVFGHHFCIMDTYRQEINSAYNHPRYLTGREVQEATEALAEVSQEKLFEPYPEQLDQTMPLLKGKDMAWEYFQKLRDFYIASATRGDGVLISIG